MSGEWTPEVDEDCGMFTITRKDENGDVIHIVETCFSNSAVEFIAAHSPAVMRELVERLENAEYLLRYLIDIHWDIDGDIDEREHHHVVLAGASNMHFKKYVGKE